MQPADLSLLRLSAELCSSCGEKLQPIDMQALNIAAGVAIECSRGCRHKNNVRSNRHKVIRARDGICVYQMVAYATAHSTHEER